MTAIAERLPYFGVSRGAGRAAINRYSESQWCDPASLFDEKLRAEVESVDSSVTSDLVRACDVSMPVSKPVPRWSAEIVAARVVTDRARRLLQRPTCAATERCIDTNTLHTES